MSRWRKKNKDIETNYNLVLFIVRAVFFFLVALSVVLYITLGKPMKDLNHEDNYRGNTTKVPLNPRVSDSIASSTEIPIRKALYDGFALIQKSDCNLCHQNELAVGGPTYADIAVRHKGDRDALKKIIDRIKFGGGGYWGTIPMPSYPELKNEDIEKMAKYILSLKGGRALGKTPFIEVK